MTTETQKPAMPGTVQPAQATPPAAPQHNQGDSKPSNDKSGAQQK